MPADFSILALRHPAAGHAWTVNLYDATTGESNKERAVTVVVADADGAAVSGGVLAAIDSDLQGRREVNWVIRVVSPTYTPINVVAVVVPHAGFDPDTVAERAQAAIQAALASKAWMVSPYGYDPAFVPPRVIHKNELIAQADKALGVNYIESLTVNGGNSVTLATPVALPTAGTTDVTAA